MQPTSTGRGLRPLAVWAAFLIGIYLTAAFVSRARTPINTEVWALHLALVPLPEHMESVRQDLVHPPLMYMVHRLWLAAFGLNKGAVMTLPIVFAVPAIAVFTVLARRVTTRWRLASFLFACAFITPGAPAASTRMYGLGLLLAVLAMLLWDQWRLRPGTARLVCWLAVMVLLVYTHFFGLLLVPAFVLVNCLYGARPRTFALAAALAALSFLPWLGYVWPVYRARGLEMNLWWVELIFKNPIRAAAALPMQWMGALPLSDLRVAAAVALAINIAVVLAGARQAWRAEWFRIAAILTVAPTALLFLLSVVSTNALHGRFLLGVLPAFWLSLALLGEHGGRVARAVLYLAVLPLVATCTAVSIWNIQQAPDARRAAARLARELAPGDAIVATGDVNVLYWEWSVALGRHEPIRLVRLVEPPPGLESRRLEQAELLAVMPLTKIESVHVSTGRSLWFFTTDLASLSEAARRLQELGYSPDDVDVRQSGGLRRFVSRRQPASPEASLPSAPLGW